MRNQSFIILFKANCDAIYKILLNFILSYTNLLQQYFTLNAITAFPRNLFYVFEGILVLLSSINYFFW